MILKLWEYFGPVGIGSIVAQVVVVFLLLRGFDHPRRVLLYRVAAGAAVLAYGLALLNSQHISFFREDESIPDAAAVAQQEQLRQEARGLLAQQAARIKFAEDTADDRLDLAGVDTSTGKNIYELAAAGKLPDKDAGADPNQEQVPFWKRQGPQQRDEAMQIERQAEDGAAGGDEAVPTDEAAVDPRVVLLPPNSVIAANRADALNRLSVWLILLVSLAALGGDYLWRLQRPLAPVLPLPLTGPLLDAMYPHKPHAVYWQSAPRGALVRQMRAMVAKGETFFYFGAHDPFPDAAALPRLRLGQWGVWSMPLVRYNPREADHDARYLLDLAWFGRGCVLALDSGTQLTLLRALLPLLRLRNVPHAKARQTVNLIWDDPRTFPAAALEELAWLSRHANLRLFVVHPQPASVAVANWFDEYYASGVRQPAAKPARRKLAQPRPRQ